MHAIQTTNSQLQQTINLHAIVLLVTISSIAYYTHLCMPIANYHVSVQFSQ